MVEWYEIINVASAGTKYRHGNRALALPSFPLPLSQEAHDDPPEYAKSPNDITHSLPLPKDMQVPLTERSTLLLGCTASWLGSLLRSGTEFVCWGVSAYPEGTA